MSEKKKLLKSKIQKIQIQYLVYQQNHIRMKIFGKENAILFYLMAGYLLVLLMNLKSPVM